MEKISRRKFVTTAAAVGAGAVFRMPAFAVDSQTSASPGAKSVNYEVVRPQASAFPMKNVRLQPGVFSAAAEANRKYLKTLPTDRLLHTFRLTAGLPLRQNRWETGKNQIPSCVATSPADIVFRHARWRLPVQVMRNSSVKVT